MRPAISLLPLFLLASSYAGTPRSLHSCTVCHIVRTSGQEEAKRPLVEVCRSCHDGVSAPNHDSSDRELEARLPGEGEYQHVRLTWALNARQSMDMSNCLRCHNPHIPNKGHVKTDTADCRVCHSDR